MSSENEEAAKQQTEQQSNVIDEKPPTEYVTNRDREFRFGRPALKHRATITKCLKFLASGKGADYDEIINCAKARGMKVEDFVKLDETQLSEDEKRAIVKGSDTESNMEMADMMNELLTEILYATIKKAPFTFTTIADFEEKMDDYAEAVELFPIAVRWISDAAQDLTKIDKKN